MTSGGSRENAVKNLRDVISAVEVCCETFLHQFVQVHATLIHMFVKVLCSNWEASSHFFQGGKVTLPSVLPLQLVHLDAVHVGLAISFPAVGATVFQNMLHTVGAPALPITLKSGNSFMPVGVH